MLFLVNYQAGQRKAYRLFIKKILPELRDKKIPFSLQISHSHQQSLSIAREAIERKENIIAVCGGDGTLNSILSPLIGSKTKLAVLPFGSANDFAVASLAISRSPIKAFKRLLEGKSRFVDVGQIKLDGEKKKYFLNVFGLGIDAAIAQSICSSKFLYRCPIKEVRYGLPLISKLVTYQGIRTSVWANDELVFRGKAFFLTALNGKREGAYFWLNRRGEIDDGLLEIVVIENMPEYQRFFYLAKIIARKMDQLSLFHHFQSDHFRIEIEQKNSSSSFYAQTDGELIVLSKRNIRLSILPKAIQIIS